MFIKSGIRKAAALLLLIAGASLCGSPDVKAAGGGSVDSTFNANATNALNSFVRAIAVQPDGKLIIGGAFVTINEEIILNIARLHANGTPDAAFNSNVRTNAAVHKVKLLPDGKILIAGIFTRLNGNVCYGLARLNADGTFDTSFNSSVSAGYVSAMALQPDGKIIISGFFDTGGGTESAFRVARLHTDGSLDGSFTSVAGIDSDILDVVLQDDGKVVIGGQFSTIDGVTRNGMARLNADGTLDASLNPFPNHFVILRSLAMQPDGKILAGGIFQDFDTGTSTYLVRFNSNGTKDTSFAPPVNAELNTILLDPNGKILIGGAFAFVGNGTRNGIARLNTDGTLDASFNPGTGADGNVRALALQADSRIVLGGSFRNVNGVSRNKLARVDSAGALDAAFNPFLAAVGIINTVIAQPDGKLIVGGSFHRISGVDRGNIARLNANGSIDASFNPGSGTNAAVNALAVQPDGKLLVAGAFTAVNGVTRNGIARLNADGTLDTSFTSPLRLDTSPIVNSVALQADGKSIIGGSFTARDGFVFYNRLVRLHTDGTLDTTFAPVILSNTTIQAVVIQPDGQVVVGGSFNGFGGHSRKGIARLNTDGSVDTSFDPGSGANSGIGFPSVLEVVRQPDGKFIIGGLFATFNGVSRNNIVRLNADGSVDTSFDPGTGTSFTVSAVMVQPDGDVVIGGSFVAVNDVLRRYVARLNANGSLDTTFKLGAGVDAPVLALAMQPGGKIIIGGSFTAIGNVIHFGLARLHGSTAGPGDFDGDGRTDISVWQSDSGKWHIIQSGDSSTRLQFWGQSSLGDIAVPGDYDGDGLTDISIFRPSDGNWYILQSSDGASTLQGWGQAGDKPVPADYDGDGRTDVAVYRLSEGNWYIKKSSGGSIAQGWGDPTDKLVPADYDGDGRADIAVFRPTDGNWYILKSTGGLKQQQWGISEDQPVPGDYDGDGITDIAVYRKSEGNWYIVKSSGGGIIRNWGDATDQPVPGDYDSDGLTDIAVWRPSQGTWYIIQSSTNSGAQHYLGLSADTPIPAAYLPQ